MTETGTEVAVHGKGSGYLESFSGEGIHLCFRLVPVSVDCVSGTLHAIGLKVDLGGPAMSFMAYLHEVIVDNNIDFSIGNGSGSSNWSRVRVWGLYWVSWTIMYFFHQASRMSVLVYLLSCLVLALNMLFESEVMWLFSRSTTTITPSYHWWQLQEFGWCMAASWQFVGNHPLW